MISLNGQLINYWTDKGHTFGQCYVDRTLDLMYVNIPKNASTFTKVNHFGWTVDNYYKCEPTSTVLVVLRDPIDRWLSGISEYFYRYQQDISNITDLLESDEPSLKLYLDLIFNQITFDDHTEKQIRFINDIDFNKCVFFKCDLNFPRLYSEFYRTNFNLDNQFNLSPWYNVTKDYPKKQKIKELFRIILKRNRRYKDQLMYHFRQDYELIKEVKFYGHN